MQLSRTLLLTLTTASFASGQVIVGTAPVSGSAAVPEVFHVDVASQVATGPLWGGVSAMGLAADDAGGMMYMSVVGAGNGADLYRWPYNDPNPPTLVGRITNPATGGTLRLEGLTWANGALHAVQLLGTTTNSPEGIYRIDLNTLTATAVYIFPDTTIDVNGLGFNPTNGRFYCTNDGGAYPSGRGIVEVDPVAQTETWLAPYPAGRTDIDGCAVSPAGIVFLVEDETSPLHMYDLNTGTYVANPPLNPVTLATVHSGGAWAPSLLGGGTLGMNYCNANPNSTGAPSVISATGSLSVAANDVTLAVNGLPQNAFAYFLTSRQQGMVANPGGSQGILCLGGGIGRYVGPGQIKNSGAAGAVSLQIDLGVIPQPAGAVAAIAGDTWNFTCWHRDVLGGTPTSNFSNGVELDFVQ